MWKAVAETLLQLGKGGVGIIGQLLAQHVLYEVEVIGALYPIAPCIKPTPYPLVCHRLGSIVIGKSNKNKRVYTSETKKDVHLR